MTKKRVLMGWVILMVLMAGCAKKQDVETLKQQLSVAQEKSTQLEARLNSTELKMVELSTELTKVKGVLTARAQTSDRIVSRQAQATRKKPSRGVAKTTKAKHKKTSLKKKQRQH